MNALTAWLGRRFGARSAPRYGSIVDGKGRITTATNVVVGTTAVQVLALNMSRRVALLTNNGTAVVYLGKDNGVTTATGTPLAIGASLTDTESGGAWWAISGTAAQDFRCLEIV